MNKWEVKGYQYSHHWMYRNFGKADHCESKDCNGKSTRYHWHNISGTYIKDRSDWSQLCVSCHKNISITDETREKARIGSMGNKNAPRKKVTAFNLDGSIYKEYESFASASRELGIYVSSISNCVSGRNKTSGGLIWVIQ